MKFWKILVFFETFMIFFEKYIDQRLLKTETEDFESGSWFQVHGVRFLVSGSWCQVLGFRFMVSSSWFRVLGFKFFVQVFDSDSWFQVLDQFHSSGS
jgi:hypothetical protein